MRFPSLKCGVRIELWVRVFERDHESNGKATVGETVDPAAAVHVRRDWPAQCMRHKTRLDAPRLDVPQLLDADPVGLRIDIVELLCRNELFRE